MTFGQILFGFRGRIARLPYLGYGCLGGLLTVLMVGVALTLASDQGKLLGGNFGALFAILSGVASGIVFLWITLALTIKRLHDLDLSGLHMIWIWALGFLGSAFYEASPVAATVLTVASLCVSLYLLFAPGTAGPNRLGPRPGADPAAAPSGYAA